MVLFISVKPGLSALKWFYCTQEHSTGYYIETQHTKVINISAHVKHGHYHVFQIVIFVITNDLNTIILITQMSHDTEHLCCERNGSSDAPTH